MSRANGGKDLCDLDLRWVGVSIDRGHWHFHRKLLERYGLVLGPGDFSVIVSALRSGAALMIEARKHGQAIYSVRVRSAGERIFVLARGDNLITAWPPSRRLNDLRRARTGKAA